ncbi:hypothetical protein F4813DRAFT_396661 [Daldinia decipiens]|uniref:uncharacterized protein n=1 Tax=Daldinia decipiens TaxID=326647 RepID=UPI0020C3288E|nr:uncharacterized protein F4813DRAFT_396661 [Daldinia decipiens]KAI1657167.1 hypothetical protein F4813DRAFT_396661 [Daldinia decipiens]
MDFKFPGFEPLMDMNARKLSTFPEEVLHSTHQTTLLHSLEGFVDKIDFDRISHHLLHGAMMASPSSTAAYLMNASEWSEDAEAYLRFVVDASNGGVPSAFPITIFEITWVKSISYQVQASFLLKVLQVLSTLLESGFTIQDLGVDSVYYITNFLETQLRNGSGITGFAPDILPDTDDTAKAILTLSLLKRPASCEDMIKTFESQTHFKTYSYESTASFSANCNVLNAIIRSTNPSLHLPQVNKSLNFLCQTWYEGKLSDKWMFTRTANNQSPNGSWKDSPEITAYAVLTLKKLAPLPWIARILDTRTRESIDCGINYLEANEARWDTPEFIWVEKVTYGSKLLSETYCLAALRASSFHNWTEKATGLFPTPMNKISSYTHFFSKLPLFSQEPVWRLQASIVEGYMFAPILRSTQSELQVFPGNDDGSDNYFDYIPITWTSCNNATDFTLWPEALYEMMIIAMLNFQADKYLEDVSDNDKLRGNFESLKTVVHQLYKNAPKKTTDTHEGNHKNHAVSGNKRRKLDSSEGDENPESQDFDKSYPFEILQGTEHVLSRFTTYILSHRKVSSANSVLQRRVREELLTFILAHIAHSKHSSQLSTTRPQDEIQIFTQAQTSYYSWMPHRSGELAEKSGNGFPQFQSQQQQGAHLEEALRKLFDIATYERECLEHAVDRLRGGR